MNGELITQRTDDCPQHGDAPTCVNAELLDVCEMLDMLTTGQAGPIYINGYVAGKLTEALAKARPTRGEA